MINQWIANIVGVIVLGTLMDMIIPKGNLKPILVFRWTYYYASYFTTFVKANRSLS